MQTVPPGSERRWRWLRLAPACPRLASPRFTLYGWPVVPLAVFFTIHGYCVEAHCLVKIKVSPLKFYGGKRLTQVALVSNGILLLLYVISSGLSPRNASQEQQAGLE